MCEAKMAYISLSKHMYSRVQKHHYLGILISGGEEANGSMEYYFPNSRHLNRLVEQTMITARWDHVSVLMADGRILIAGGMDRNSEILSSCELFDPSSGQVEAGPEMAERRVWAAAAAIADSVYVCGGFSGVKMLNSCENFQSNRWTAVTSMAQERTATMVALHGKLFVIGGRGARRPIKSVERFDSIRNRWDFVSPMPKGRMGHEVAVLNGWIYVCGGKRTGRRDVLRDCERYNPQTDRWQAAAAMQKSRDGFCLVEMDGRLYAVGGWTREERTSVESYDAGRNEWILLEQPLVHARSSASALVL